MNEAFQHLEADAFSLPLPDIVKETVAETLGAIIRANVLFSPCTVEEKSYLIHILHPGCFNDVVWKWINKGPLDCCCCEHLVILIHYYEEIKNHLNEVSS